MTLAPPRAFVARLRRAVEVGGPIAALLLVGSFLVWPPVRQVETGGSRAYPDLRPRVYACPPATAITAAMRAIAGLPRWRSVRTAHPTGELACEARSMVWGFTDDIAIRCTPSGAGTRVWLRSSSRVGRFDFGQNARNIRALFAALDHELSGTAYEEER